MYHSMKSIYFPKLITLGITALFISMCVPPEDGQADEDAAYDEYLDSLREIRCPRLLSSAAEYYKNRDWHSTINVYREIVELGCDRDDPVEVYQYYAVAFESLGLYDSSEFVLVKGLQQLPNNVQLRKRLVYAYSKQGKTDLQIAELNRLSELMPDDLEIKMEEMGYDYYEPETGEPFTKKDMDGMIEERDRIMLEVARVADPADRSETTSTGLSDKAYRQIWRMCESYEKHCIETNQPGPLPLNIVKNLPPHIIKK